MTTSDPLPSKSEETFLMRMEPRYRKEESGSEESRWMRRLARRGGFPGTEVLAHILWEGGKSDVPHLGIDIVLNRLVLDFDFGAGNLDYSVFGSAATSGPADLLTTLMNATPSTTCW